MEEQFLTFQSFTIPDQAQDICRILAEQDIPFYLDDASPPLDPVIIGSPLEPILNLKIRKQDFLRAKTLLENYYSSQLDNIDPEYYLFSFPNEELMDILHKPDEWGSLDYQLARKILQDRGLEIHPELLQQFKSMRLKAIAKPDSIKLENVWIGYLLSIVFSPLGLIYGSTILSHKKILPDGNRVFTYNAKSREQAGIMVTISVVLIAIWFLAFLFRDR